MPAGVAPFGFAYFAAAKFIGYTAYCRLAIKPQLWEDQKESAIFPSSLKAGVIRTLIGLSIGAFVGLGFWKIPYFAKHSDFDTLWFFAVLVPVRVGEWWLLLHWVYGRFELSNRQIAALIFWGIIASFALDGLGILAAFVLPGGAWVC